LAPPLPPQPLAERFDAQCLLANIAVDQQRHADHDDFGLPFRNLLGDRGDHVASSRLSMRGIVVVPRNGDPIVIDRVVVPQATVFVAVGVPIERRERRGGDRFAIGLDEVQAGVDRIWWRGVVSSPARVDANRVRVRAEN
jgi:hypothetical protein